MEWAACRHAQELAMRRVRLTPRGGTGIGEIDLRQGPTPENVRYYERAVRFLGVRQIEVKLPPPVWFPCFLCNDCHLPLRQSARSAAPKREPALPPFFDADREPQEILAELRVEIDRIDSEVHELLMARGEIIDRLIAVKARQGGGSAFRPGREAEMMRRLAERHRGVVPLDCIESIWRIVIATFTYVQSNYVVHADVSAGDAAMRDTERFHFGFTVPFIPHNGPAGVIEAVARSSGDLGMFPVDGGAHVGPWWTQLIGSTAPKIIARLPFVERAEHPAGMPVFVIAKPLQDAAAREEVLYCLHIERSWDGLPANIKKIGGEIIGNVADEMGLALLLAVPKNVHPDEIRNALYDGNILGGRIDEVGCHASRFKL